MSRTRATLASSYETLSACLDGALAYVLAEYKKATPFAIETLRNKVYEKGHHEYNSVNSYHTPFTAEQKGGRWLHLTISRLDNGRYEPVVYCL